MAYTRKIKTTSINSTAGEVRKIKILNDGEVVDIKKSLYCDSNLNLIEIYNINPYYTVSFQYINDNETTTISTLILEGGKTIPTIPTAPNIVGWVFSHWLLGGVGYVETQIKSIQVDSDLTFFAYYIPQTTPKKFEVGDVLPLKIRIFFDTESNYYNLYKPIFFPDQESILGVKCGASLFPIAIFNPDVFPPEDNFESNNYVFFSDGSSLIKIYDLVETTWLTSRITCDLSGFTEAERTVGYVTNSFPVADFLNGITYESREYYNIYFNNVYVGEMPTLKLVDVSKIPDTPPVPVRAGYTFGGWFNEDYTIQYFGGEVLTDDIDLYARWELNT